MFGGEIFLRSATPIVFCGISAVMCNNFYFVEKDPKEKKSPVNYISFIVIWVILLLFLGIAWAASAQIKKTNNDIIDLVNILNVAFIVGWIATYGCFGTKEDGLYVQIGGVMAALALLVVTPKYLNILVAPYVGWMIFSLILMVLPPSQVNNNNDNFFAAVKENSPSFGNIVKLFNETTWKKCGIMELLGIKLDNYAWMSQKKNAERVYQVLKEGRMPPEGEEPWSEEKINLVKRWIDAGMPE